MKITKLLILALLIGIGYSSFSQAKLNGTMMINGGIARSDLYNKNFILGISTSVGLLYPEEQLASYFIDFNFAYNFASEKWKCKPVIGLGYSPMGFDEKGITPNDSQKLVPYYLRVKIEYVSIFAGISYTLIKNKWINLKLIQTLNPMKDVNKIVYNLQKFGLSARTTLVTDIKYKGGGIISFSPFFQTSITKFNKNKIYQNSPNYYPYSYGINVGAYFKS